MSDAAQELAAGTIIAGRYRVDRCVGRGGMGAVYLVRHVNTDERLALKVLHATVLANAMAVERFRREARAPAQIDSDHVVRVTDADTAPELGGAPFLVMEFLKGQDLEHEVEQHGALPPERVVLYLKQAARALDKAHTLGIVHRDLKPENLFLAARDDGTPCIKILDFGIAKITGGSAQALQGGKTETGTITGTPMFMSPEQIRGDNANVTSATDVWALGLIAFRLLSGGRYWTADTLPMLVAQIVYEPLEPPSVRGVSLGTSFDEWFAKCCARDPAARFNSAGVAIEALEKALGLGARQSQPHFGVTAMAQTSPAMAATSPLAASLQGASVSHAAMTPPPKRSSRVWMLIGGVAIVALGAVGGGVVSHSRSAAGVTTSAATSNAGAITTITATAEATALVATITADPQTVTTGTVRLPTVQPRVAGSGRRETSSAVATVSSPLPPPSASATVKKPTDNELLNSQH